MCVNLRVIFTIQKRRISQQFLDTLYTIFKMEKIKTYGLIDFRPTGANESEPNNRRDSHSRSMRTYMRYLRCLNIFTMRMVPM
jgi:hypothetical protein